MSVLSVDDYRARSQSPLSDSALQLLIDNAEAEIARRIGAPYVDGSTSVSLTRRGYRPAIYLPRRIASVASVTEIAVAGGTGTAIAASGYAVDGNVGEVLRLPDGTLWGHSVTVAFIPVDDRRQWIEAAIGLVRLAESDSPYASESIAGEYSYSRGAAVDVVRAEIMRRAGLFAVVH